MRVWWNGIHTSLRSWCLRTWGFESPGAHRRPRTGSVQELGGDGMAVAGEGDPMLRGARRVRGRHCGPDLLGPQAFVDPVLEHLDDGVRGHVAAGCVEKEGSNGCH